MCQWIVGTMFEAKLRLLSFNHLCSAKNLVFNHLYLTFASHHLQKSFINSSSQFSEETSAHFASRIVFGWTFPRNFLLICIRFGDACKTDDSCCGSFFLFYKLESNANQSNQSSPGAPRSSVRWNSRTICMFSTSTVISMEPATFTTLQQTLMTSSWNLLLLKDNSPDFAAFDSFVWNEN